MIERNTRSRELPDSLMFRVQGWKSGNWGNWVTFNRGASPPRKFGMVFVLVRHYQFRHAELLHGIPCVWPPIATIAPPRFHFTNKSIVSFHFLSSYSLWFLSTLSRIFDIKTGPSFILDYTFIALSLIRKLNCFENNKVEIRENILCILFLRIVGIYFS